MLSARQRKQDDIDEASRLVYRDCGDVSAAAADDDVNCERCCAVPMMITVMMSAVML